MWRWRCRGNFDFVYQVMNTLLTLIQLGPLPLLQWEQSRRCFWCSLLWKPCSGRLVCCFYRWLYYQLMFDHWRISAFRSRWSEARLALYLPESHYSRRLLRHRSWQYLWIDKRTFAFPINHPILVFALSVSQLFHVQTSCDSYCVHPFRPILPPYALTILIF